MLATEIEYDSMFCFSSTPEGYQVKLRSKLDGLGFLGEKGECFEDAQEAMTILRRICR